MMVFSVRHMVGRVSTVLISGNVYGKNRAREARSSNARPDRTERGRAPCACGERGINAISLEY